MCGRYSLAPDESKGIAQIVAEVQSRFGGSSIHTGEIFPTNAAPILMLENKKRKTKYHFHWPDRDVLYLAGLWNVFQGEKRFVVLTTAPNDTIINVHDRMPVILTEAELEAWLHDTGIASAKLTVMQPALESIAV